MASSSEASITNLIIHKVPNYQLWRDQYGTGIGVNDVVIIPPIELQPRITINGILKGNGSGTITAAIAGTDYQPPLSFGSSTTTFLRNDGSWATPVVTYSLSTATNTTLGGVKPWYSHTSASTGPTTGNNSTAITVNAITTTSGKYYAIEADSNGRLFVNVPWNNTNTDTKVTQSSSTTTNWRKLLLHYKDDTTSTTAVTSSTEQVYAAVGISAQASTGTLRASIYNVADKVQLQWNATTEALDFVFI